MPIKLPTSQIFLPGTPLSLHKEETFGPLLQGLVRRLSRFRCGSLAKQQLILELNRLCHPLKDGKGHSPHNQRGAATFREEIAGLLYLIVESRLSTDTQGELPFQEIADLGAPPLSKSRRSASIIAGVYIHPDTASLLRYNEGRGLMMDTTWSVMQHYVTSILVAVKNNTVIPIVFSFGPTESHELLSSVLSIFQREMGRELGGISRSLRSRISPLQRSARRTEIVVSYVCIIFLKCSLIHRSVFT
jgi:hypothetical protein